MCPCPTPFKERFDSAETARAALRAVEKRADRFTGSHPNRCYRCECGSWHLTGDVDAAARVSRRRYADSNHRNKKASHRRKWSRYHRRHR